MIASPDILAWDHVTERRKALQPAQPTTAEETGLGFLFLLELLVKTLFRHGQLKLQELASYTKLAIGVLEPILDFMRKERLCEVLRASGTSTAVSYSLSELGRERAGEYLKKSQYVGPAPVSLAAYIEQVGKQSVAHMEVTREKLREAFKGVTVREALLTQFGAAMNSGRAIFVYGPAGSGKTYLAERMVGVLSGDVAVPYSIAVDNEVIQVFDPLVHKPLVAEQPIPSELDRRTTSDGRWVMCHRPVTKTGGELTLSILDLDFDQNARFYHAPPQVKAQNGLLIIDDLGRQLAPAIDIMNRWIVPLDRRVDYLSLHTGKKFMIPFDVIVVFSSNLTPEELADEAFLRRLGYKIFVGELQADEYLEITRQVCRELNIPITDAGLDHLLNKHRLDRKPLVACTPRDILCQARDLAIYEEEKPELSEWLIDWAWNNYFASETHQ